MINYSDDMNIAYCDGYKFVRDKKSNYYLSSKKINGKRLRLHIYVWTKSNGKIPKGYHIHHVDKNKLNNDISNLMCVTKKEHESLHKEDKRKYDENLLMFMQELAKEWSEKYEHARILKKKVNMFVHIVAQSFIQSVHMVKKKIDFVQIIVKVLIVEKWVMTI